MAGSQPLQLAVRRLTAVSQALHAGSTNKMAVWESQEKHLKPKYFSNTSECLRKCSNNCQKLGMAGLQFQIFIIIWKRWIPGWAPGGISQVVWPVRHDPRTENFAFSITNLPHNCIHPFTYLRPLLLSSSLPHHRRSAVRTHSGKCDKCPVALVWFSFSSPQLIIWLNCFFLFYFSCHFIF